MHDFKRLLAFFVILAFLLPITVIPAHAAGSDEPFSDVPQTHFAYKAIQAMRSLDVTSGAGNNKFGMGQTIKRCEFITFLVKLAGWDKVSPEKGSFQDDQDKGAYYYAPIETALQHGAIIKDSDLFRVNDPITREEMAVMIVRALGYDSLAKQKQISDLNFFTDVNAYQGYIAIAKDFGIMSGTGGTTFSPGATAKREEAAYMLMKMYDRLNRSISEVHAFYALGSFSQASMIASLDSVSFGWSRLEFDAGSNQVILNTSRNNNNEYGFPQGFADPLGQAQANGVPSRLMVAVKDETVTDPASGGSMSLVDYIISKPEIRKQAVDSIVQTITSSNIYGQAVSFTGAVVDFEGLKGESDRKSFNEFLTELSQRLKQNSKSLYVLVQPAWPTGYEYFDGYDFKTIGELADKVILMAHNYYATSLPDSLMSAGYTDTPLTPIDKVYYALRAITDKNTGVQDISKILLQISFDSVLWKRSGDAVINKTPDHPFYTTIQQKLALDDAVIKYSSISQNPYVNYTDSQTGTSNIIWYEDSHSVEAKMKLATMFGIKGISIWRLGNIPDFSDSGKALYLDVWQQILRLTGK